jgi:hypothetical protein
VDEVQGGYIVPGLSFVRGYILVMGAGRQSLTEVIPKSMAESSKAVVLDSGGITVTILALSVVSEI